MVSDTITMIINDIEYDIKFTVIKGYKSRDSFQPSEPDEIIINNILYNDIELPLRMFNLYIEKYEDDIIEYIESKKDIY